MRASTVIKTMIFIFLFICPQLVFSQDDFASSARDTGGEIYYSFLEAVRNFMAFLPALLGAILILVIGWIVSGFLAKLIAKGLKLIGVEKAVQSAGLGTYVQRSGAKWTTSDLIALMVKWFIRLIFIQAAANILRMPQITTIINSIILFIPKVIVAIAIIVIGSLVAKLLAAMVHNALSRTDAANPNTIANITRYAVTGFAIVAAINQLEIAEVVVNTFYISLVGSVALALGLAFGLGGREVAAQMTQRWYNDARSFAERAKASLPANTPEAPRRPPQTSTEIDEEVDREIIRKRRS